MKGKLVYLETKSLDPRYNLAFEEYVLCNKKDEDYLILWQNENTIVIGQNQNAAEEINSTFVKEHNINVVRRSTGGGAVYHDLGNLNYSFITNVGDAETITMERFTKPIVKELQKMGLRAEASGRNDILVEGKKVSGTAQRIVKGRILHHGTLLFDSDPEMVSGALNVDPKKFRSKSTKSVRSRIGNIRDFLPQDMELPDFWERLKINLTDHEAEKYELSETEISEIQKIKEEKYDTWEWNYGRSPEYTMTNKRYWDGGCLEVRSAIERGIVKDMIFYGDFLSTGSTEDIIHRFIGAEYSAESMKRILSGIEIEKYFGTITAEEILNTMF